MKKLLTILLLSTLSIIVLHAQSQKTAELTVFANQGKRTIDKHIYGHFSERLGRCIYGGIWVRRIRKCQISRGIERMFLRP
ncbi:MAG: hypothetical protein U5K79_22965 [Cyclobacteriaceae bacterium]|nr:hypothetical protein [Cyclobacteriaceae bacterium]